MLDNSWIKHYEKENYIDVYQLGCLSGASDFQKKAIEKLKKPIDCHITFEYEKGFKDGIQKAIRIIKNLKA